MLVTLISVMNGLSNSKMSLLLATCVLIGVILPAMSKMT